MVDILTSQVMESPMADIGGKKRKKKTNKTAEMTWKSSSLSLTHYLSVPWKSFAFLAREICICIILLSRRTK